MAEEMGHRAGVEEEQASCNVGNAYDNLGRFQEAVEFHNKHLSISKEVGDKAGEGFAYCHLGNAYQSLGRFQEAIEFHNKHLTISKEMGDKAGEGNAYGNLGIAYRSLGRFQEAVEFHNKHLSISKEVGDKAGERKAYCHLGNAYQSLGRFQEAIEFHNKHLSISKEVGDRAGERSAHGNLGNAYNSLGRFKKAVEFHNKCLSISKEVGDKAGEGFAYCHLGNAYQGLGRFQEAIESHNKHLSISKAVGYRAGEGSAYGNLGIAYNSLGRFKKAVEFHNKHLTISKGVGDKAGEGIAYSNLGIAYQSLGRFQEAIEFHNKGLTISKEVGDKAGEGIAYSNLGIAYQSLRRFQEAIEFHNKHLSISKEVDDRAGVGFAYCNLGNAYQCLGIFQKAVEFHNKHLSISKEVGDKDGEGKAYGTLGIAYRRLGRFEEALEFLKRYLSISKEVGNRPGEGLAYLHLGTTYHDLHKFQKAKESFQSSVDVFEIVRASLGTEDAWKISFHDTHCNAFKWLWHTLLNHLDMTGEALFAAERGRAQALVDALKVQHGLTTLSLPSLETKETISYISNEFSTQTVFIGIEGNIIVFWVIKKENKFELRRVEVGGRKGNRYSITALLNTTLKNIGAGVRVRCENRSLQPADDSKREGEGAPAQTSKCTIDSLQPLHDAIIGPIADLCHGDDLIIVPDGPLCLAPFSALSQSKRIRTVPSLTSLKLIVDSPKDYHSKSGVLLVGDPCLEKVTKRGQPMYLPLPCAKMEVEMIGRILKVSPFTGTEATKKKVLEKIGPVALVHIAAHGKEETGEIALAPNAGWENNTEQGSKNLIPKEEDYILKMSDVLATGLRARLVVLSCCHSGRGEVKSEGVVGIARAFLAAGARSVLATLWRISDKATMVFMESFYQHLADGKKASFALHQAMKTLRNSETFCDVKYWAPFVLIGDDVRLEFGNQSSESCK